MSHALTIQASIHSQALADACPEHRVVLAVPEAAMVLMTLMLVVLIVAYLLLFALMNFAERVISRDRHPSLQEAAHSDEAGPIGRHGSGRTAA
jgi:fructoselysine-6-P-deglycase FrlB-like protein